ncbi:hypothetical protein ACFQYP_38905 [Nonomuraea antimicrobica]
MPDDQPEVRAAKELLIAEFRRSANEEAERALASVDRESEEWRDATHFSRHRIRVDAEELVQIYRQIEELLEPYIARQRKERDAPKGARLAEAQINLFPVQQRPVPGLPTEDHDARSRLSATRKQEAERHIGE